MNDERTITLPVEDIRLLHRAASMAAELFDAVEQRISVPEGAPLYGERDRLQELARQLDHETNCEQVGGGQGG